MRLATPIAQLNRVLTGGFSSGGILNSFYRDSKLAGKIRFWANLALHCALPINHGGTGAKSIFLLCTNNRQSGVLVNWFKKMLPVYLNSTTATQQQIANRVDQFLSAIQFTKTVITDQLDGALADLRRRLESGERFGLIVLDDLNFMVCDQLVKDRLDQGQWITAGAILGRFLTTLSNLAARYKVVVVLNNTAHTSIIQQANEQLSVVEPYLLLVNIVNHQLVVKHWKFSCDSSNPA